MSISLFAPNGRYKDLKWIPIMPDPTNASLVSAVLPDDLIITIVEHAAQDTPTALPLAQVSKAVGRMAESVLYASVTLRLPPAVHIFTNTLRTKNRRVLAGVTQLEMSCPAPPDYEDFWGLIGQRCPHIKRLSLVATDFDALRSTPLRPQHLTISSSTPQGYLSPYDTNALPPDLWDQVSHLHLLNHAPTALVPRLQAGGFRNLTHFCLTGAYLVRANDFENIRLFLRLPALRVFVAISPFPRGTNVANVFLDRMPNDRRLVGILPDTMGDTLRHDPCWEFAERTIEARPR
ncbi:hypothetical protein DFH06DRAFT_1159227 [Mycena polygramma]|nr:hypothetical protein DFH06DRAFT_1159227 [Mycena polygramma]